MKVPVLWLRWFLLVLVVMGAGLMVGCASTESDNRSERPWSTPQSWETGLPSGMYDQHR